LISEPVTEYRQVWNALIGQALVMCLPLELGMELISSETQSLRMGSKDSPEGKISKRSSGPGKDK
jgi:hypothetical protein